ncbi:uncharacterized protein YydD (DUF2326 family) [Clavibacter michiganensis]|uniref:DUF2326 domain-containing protein n=1 Tax=Clavibacter michiganensis TaxID=28447 RepID=UPI0019581A8D|nr:DUF2326 domain-containing protein [Clavibacter michiganensis]MBM7411970.1 uncharacterized protein YydD (DUF2326 family) [Clavibacter michiganensis]
MLIELGANKPSFTPIRFTSGMNVVLADRTAKATRTDSRNARGKSSILLAINYCLGGSFPQAFKPLADDDWRFDLTIKIGDSIVTASRRCGVERNLISIALNEGPRPAWFSLMDEGVFRLDTWKSVLGWTLFGLPELAADEDRVLSARTLLSYVVRTNAPDDPTKIIAQQSARLSRMHTSYLLGLDWTVNDRLAKLKEEEQAYKAVDAAVASEYVAAVVGNEADLLMERQEAVIERDRVAEHARNFVLLDDPDDVIKQADDLTADVNGLRNEIYMTRQMMSLHESSLAESQRPSANETLDQLRLELAGVIKKKALLRLDQVEEFHARIYQNRVAYLGVELEELRQRKDDLEGRLKKVLAKRTRLLEQVHAGGVLDELLALQRSHIELAAVVRDLDLQLDALRRWARAREEVNVRKSEVRVTAADLLAERQSTLDHFATRFDAVIRSLYGKGGALTVKVDEDGYKVDLTVPASSSTGVKKMKLFSYDLTLLWEANREVHPGFLIHDSVVFDGVDPAQTQTALEQVQEAVLSSPEEERQYIVLLNSNEVPDELAATAWFQTSIRRRIIESEIGGAFGILF